MTLSIAIECPSCPAEITFEPPPGGRSAGRLYARCDSCGAAYGLWGGRLLPLEGPIPQPSRQPSSTAPP